MPYVANAGVGVPQYRIYIFLLREDSARSIYSMDHRTKAAARGSGATSHSGVSINPKSLYPHSTVTHADGMRVSYPSASQLVLHQNVEDRIFY